MDTGEITEGLEWGSFEVSEQAAAQAAVARRDFVGFRPAILPKIPPGLG